MDTNPSTTALNDAAPVPFGTRFLPLRFSGSSSEYFRVWLVNVALTVLTLGIYGAWAKVRTRRYFYGHTWLDGHNFEYTANPVAILIGHLIVGTLFAVYVVSQSFADENIGLSLVGLALLLVFFVLTPYLVFKSLRFLARNTVYRGLRFGFHGSLAEAYGKYLGWPLLVPFTLGLLFPFVVHLQRTYLADHAGYGSARASFRGRVGDVYIIYLIGVALGIGVYVVGFALLAASFVPLALNGGDLGDLLSNLGSSPGFVVLAALAYLAVILGLAAVGQFIKASLMNYTLNHVELAGGVRVQSRVNPWMLTWIGVSNVLAQVFTLGLATPWAAVRRAKYVLGSVALLTTVSLGDFTASLSAQESALGEVATDFFGIDLGF